MTIELTQIDENVALLLKQLAAFQNGDGSFTTHYLQPQFQPEKGWMEYPDNSPFCTASVIIPLLNIKDKRVDEITQKSIDFLKERSLEMKLWRFADLSNDYVVPYDTDSTALSSFVLEKKGINVDNKQLLDDQINANGQYDLWIRPQGFSLFNIKIWKHNRKASRCIPLESGAIQFGDYEFTVTCNNLLYVGKNNRNTHVWQNVHQLFAKSQTDRLYYPDLLNGFHAYARMCFYQNVDLHTEQLSAIASTIESHRYVINDNQSIGQILLANSILYLNVDIQEHTELFKKCIEQINADSPSPVAAFYCSNLRTDLQTDGKSPNTYFGSPAITCALYLEFLNLYRKRVYNCYFGES